MEINPQIRRMEVYSGRNVLLIASLGAVYLALSYFLIGFKPEQVFLVGLFFLLYFLSAPTRRFILGFSIFIVYWIVFDYMKAFPNYHYNPVHIESMYQAEKNIFGIFYQGSHMTLNEFFLRKGNTPLDITAGLFYLTWIPVPLLFGAFLFYRDRQRFFHFSLTFFLVNILGFVIYYLYPAAPPWYVQQHGFTFLEGTGGNTAGLSKFDQFFHTGIFRSIYAKSSNVFAALPSLHSAYPAIVLYFGIKSRVGLINLPLAIIMAGIWFSAVYTSHHYVIDVLCGIGCGIAGMALFEWLLVKSSRLNSFVDHMVRLTT